MSIFLNINDETSSGRVTGSVRVEFKESLVTIGQLIEQRVRAEVERYNAKPGEVFQGLVQPADAEVAPGGYRQKRVRLIDADQQVAIARKAFLENGFFILIDNNQAEELEQSYLLHKDSTVSFVKLIPLVGG
jgi:hypothetical protein